MSNVIYRSTTLGYALQETLDILDEMKVINPKIKMRILENFDFVISEALSDSSYPTINFKAGRLHTYRCFDDVWTFLFKDVQFVHCAEVFHADDVKVVACDGRPRSRRKRRGGKRL